MFDLVNDHLFFDKCLIILTRYLVKLGLDNLFVEMKDFLFGNELELIRPYG